MPANDSWIYQGRDEKGRFGDGTSPHSGDLHARAGDSGRGMQSSVDAAIYGAIGHLSPAERQRYASHLDQGGLSRLRDCLRIWGHAAELDHDTFRERYLGGAGRNDAVDHLRKAAVAASQAATPEQQRDASGELAAAYRLIGPDGWPRFIAAAHDQALAAREARPSGPSVPPAATKVQELLLTPRFPFLAEPPKGTIPRLMERIPRQSGKDAASDTPSWARGIPRRVGESPRDYAKRLLDDRYGPGKWDQRDTGPGSEFSRIKKYGERAFRDPRVVAPGSIDVKPEA